MAFSPRADYVGTFADIPNTTVATNVNLIKTTDGAEYVFDAAVNAAYVAQYPRAASLTANSRGFRLSFSQRVSVLMFQAPANGLDDDAPAFLAALAYLNTKATPGGYAPGTPTLYVPAGKYKLNSTINLKQCVRIQGEGCGQAGGQTSKIVLAAGVTGFIVNRYNTIGSGVESSPTTGAGGSIIDGLAFVGAGRDSTPGADGIWLRERATVSNCYFASLSRNGVRCTGTGGGGSSAEGNCNGFSLNRLRIEDCGDDAIYVAGADANAGSGIAIDISSCGGSGINDASFLGNNWYSCEVETCGYGSANRAPGSVDYQGASYAVVLGHETAAQTTVPGTNPAIWYKHVNPGGYPAWTSGKAVLTAAPYLVQNANARSTLFGCYSEAGMGPIQGVQRSQAYGCFFEENGVVGGMNWLWNRIGTLTTTSIQALDGGFQTVLGGDPNSAQHLLMQGPGSGTFRWTTQGADIVLTQDNFYSPLSITGQSASEALGGRKLNSAFMARRFGLGRSVDGDFNTYGRQIGLCGSTAELNGNTVVRGDIFFYHSPVAGGKIGAVCINGGVVGATSGAIAAFKDFGMIDA